MQTAADAATIKSAYRRLAAQHHPDKGGDVAEFQAIAAAYATLSDPEKRAHYDRTGEDGQRIPSDMEMIAPLVVGAFDRATVAAIGGKQDARMAMLYGTAKGLGRTDMVASMVKLLGEDKARGEEAVAQIDHEVKQMEEMQRRLGFTGEDGSNIIASTLATRIRDAGELRAKNLHTLTLVDKAIEHVRLYGWELDPAPEVRAWGAAYQDELMRLFREQPLRVDGYRIPIMTRDEEIRLVRPTYVTPVPRESFTKARKRRTAKIAQGGLLYTRPHTCVLDAEGKQVPAPRGSWRAMESRAAELAQ